MHALAEYYTFAECIIRVFCSIIIQSYNLLCHRILYAHPKVLTCTLIIIMLLSQHSHSKLKAAEWIRLWVVAPADLKGAP